MFNRRTMDDGRMRCAQTLTDFGIGCTVDVPYVGRPMYRAAWVIDPKCGLLKPHVLFDQRFNYKKPDEMFGTVAALFDAERGKQIVSCGNPFFKQSFCQLDEYSFNEGHITINTNDGISMNEDLAIQMNLEREESMVEIDPQYAEYMGREGIGDWNSEIVLEQSDDERLRSRKRLLAKKRRQQVVRAMDY